MSTARDLDEQLKVHENSISVKMVSVRRCSTRETFLVKILPVFIQVMIFDPANIPWMRLKSSSVISSPDLVPLPKDSLPVFMYSINEDNGDERQ